MKKALIVYYSQSGNTRRALETAEKKLQENGLSVLRYSIDKIKKPLPDDWEYLVLACPMYFAVEPLIVRRFLETMPDFEGKTGIIISTYADRNKSPPDMHMIENLTELLARKGISVLGSAGLVCSDSSDIMIRVHNRKDRPNGSDWEQFDSRIGTLCTKMMNESVSSNRQPGKGSLRRENWITFNIVPKMRVYHVDCTLCGVCVKACPMNNLSIDEKLRIGTECMKCSLCENACPQKAIRPNWKLLELMFCLPQKYPKNREGIR